MPKPTTSTKSIPPVVKTIVILIGAVFMFVGGLILSGAVFPNLGESRTLVGGLFVLVGAMDIMMGLVILPAVLAKQQKQLQQHQQQQHQSGRP